MPENEINLQDVPFAEWLETILPQLCRQDARAIGIISVNRDGTVGTGYYNANAGRLREELEAAGEEPDTDAG